MKYLPTVDKQIKKLIDAETKRQQDTLMLIPSENYASKAVEEAVGSSLGNKYAEGYPAKRYYQGMAVVDAIESLAQERAKKLFGVPQVNVQPYSGSPANAAVYFAVLKPGDKIMGLTLSHGGHLTHGHPKITFSGKYFSSVQYPVNQDGFIDYVQIEKLIRKEKPQLIIAGTTAYPRLLDFKKFAYIADGIGAYLMADISHIAGLVVGGAHPSPVPYAHIVTTTTHKTLRGPRGALILTTAKGLKKDPQLADKINKAVFPGLQGGPHINTIAGIAVALKEDGTARFKKYAQQVVKNAHALASGLIDKGIPIVTGGTDNHLMVADLRTLKTSGKEAALKLEKAGIVLNYNTVPFDPNPPFNPSGIRLGTPGITSRGMKVKEMATLAGLIADVILNRRPITPIRSDVLKLCARFPVPKAY